MEISFNGTLPPRGVPFKLRKEIMTREQKQKLLAWKSKFYCSNYRNTWGQGEKPIAEWFKEKGYNIARLRAAKIFHLDMNVIEDSANQLIRTNQKILNKFVV